VSADVSGSIAQLLRVALVAFLIIHFLRRKFKTGTQAKIPPLLTRPLQGRKNDFRDVPPPPENPNMG